MFKRSGAAATVAMTLMLAGLTSCNPAPSSAAPCGRTTAPPAKYDHVIVVMEENRTWTGGASPGVGAGFDASQMPFLHGLAARCSWFSGWNETNASQDSLTQYIGITSGVDNPATVDDCSPSTSCHSNDNNIFRQVRNSGGTARLYVDGATTPCSAGTTNAERHLPALYYWGGTDQAACPHEMLPLSAMSPNGLPTFGMIVPDVCNDGHDCSDATVDSWAKSTVTRILNGSSYHAGRTLVAIVYDEDRPVPNLLIAPTAHAGIVTTPTGSHAALLKTVEQLLGLPVMNQGQLPSAVSLRTPAHI